MLVSNPATLSPQRILQPLQGLIGLWLTATLLVTGVNAEGEDTPQRSPNIILVLADDLGWSGLGCYGNQFHETPHIDRVAAQGLRFTQAYASAPVCSPYRAALLTGQHPARLGITDYLRPNSANALPATENSLARILSRHGYMTGMIGKWHLTGYEYHGAEHEIRPRDHGFQWDFGTEVKSVGNGANFWPYVFRDQPLRWVDIESERLGDHEYLTDRLNQEAVDFIERHRDEPFFLYLSHYAPHTILNGRPDLVEKYQKKHVPGKSSRDRCYLCEDAGLGSGDPGHHWAQDHNPHLAAMIESIDSGIGQIEAKLKELGLEENTLLIFTSDNGGETNVTSNDPWRGGKSQLYEGGIRIPLVAKWPKQLPSGKICSQLTQNLDLLPTLVDAIGIQEPLPENVDGISMLQTWKEPEVESDRNFLAWHYPLDRPHFLGGKSAGAIRHLDWKLIENFDSGNVELYHLQRDPGEQINLASLHPEWVSRLQSQLASWREEVEARQPSPPLLVEAGPLHFAEHFHDGQLSERLWYNADWAVEDGELKRRSKGTENTRIFLREADYQNVMIRFDFKLQGARDVRLMTGGEGGYHAVLHIRPDHFFLQTAANEKVPHFSYRHSECQFDFKPDRWYTFTVEMIGDEMVAHLDHKHLVYAKHPLIERNHDYLAIQVDQHEASFDNLQVFAPVRIKSSVDRENLLKAVDRFPVEKPVQENFEIQLSNAREWYYHHDENYRQLVHEVETLDDKLKELFPEAFLSHKERRKSIQKRRESLLENDLEFKEVLFSTYRANQAIDEWIVSQYPALADLPSNRKKAEIDRARLQLDDHPQLKELVAASEEAAMRLEEKYPELFVTDDEITEAKREAHDRLRNQPEFQKWVKRRADAYYAGRNYLLTHDAELVHLAGQLEEAR
jgi:arylsulfatase A